MATSNPPNQISEPLAAIPAYLVQNGTALGSGNPLYTTASMQNVINLTVGTAAAAGKAVQIVCTVAGNVVMTMAGTGGNITIPVNVGYNLLPFAITEIVTSGTTATATYANLS